MSAKIGADDFLVTAPGGRSDLEGLPRQELGARPILTTLSDVAPESVSWIWPGRIAEGKITLLTGEPGAGKGFLMADMTARITRGMTWPDNARTQSGNVVALTSEDGLADTIRPRVDLHGGDPARVHVLRGVRVPDGDMAFTFERDLAALEQALVQTRAAVLFVDPISAYLGRSNSYKDSEVRSILSPLGALAEQHRVAVVAVLHLTKDAQRRLLHRAQGSIAFVALARVVLAVGEDAEVPGRRLLVTVKNNIGPHAPALAFRIADDGVTWDAQAVEGSADRLLAADDVGTRTERRALDAALQFLRDLLRDGPTASKSLMLDATANGIAQRTLWRAKDELGVVAEQATIDGKRSWFWRLPEAG